MNSIICSILHRLLAYGLIFIHYHITKQCPMENLYFRVPRNTAEHVQFCLDQNSRCSTPEEFLPVHAGVILIASGVRVLAWLKEEEEEACFLAGCHFVTLALLTGNFGGLASKGSTQKWKKSASKCITLAVIVV